jgi:hypothetical protein
MSQNQHHASESTKRRTRNFLYAAVVISITAVLLVNCGGSSDSGGSSAKSIGSGRELNPGLAGTLWRPGDGIAYDSIDARTGDVRTDTFVSRYENRVPSLARDGRLVIFSNINEDAMTTFEVSEFKGWDYTITRGFPEKMPRPLYTSKSNVNYHHLYLSPDSRCMAYIYGDDSPVLATQYALKVLDFQNQADVTKVNPTLAYTTGLQNRKIAGFDWLPNGEYMFVYTDGTLMRGSCINHGQIPRAVGQIKPPATYDIAVGYQTFAISPDGSKIAVELMGDAKVKGAGLPVNVEDVWITDITGGNMQRLTVGDKSSQPLWSPDGQHIALGYETYIKGSAVNVSPYWGVPSYVTGVSGSRWYVPATARNVAYPKSVGEVGIVLQESYGVNSSISMGTIPIDLLWTK